MSTSLGTAAKPRGGRPGHSAETLQILKSNYLIKHERNGSI